MGSESVRRTSGFWLKAGLITLLMSLAGVSVGGPVEAKGKPAPRPKTIEVKVRVVTQDGKKLEALAQACPASQDIAFCETPTSAPTGRDGIATLKLVKSERYNVIAVVADPKPRWACPGNLFQGEEIYLSDNLITADASAFPKHATLVIYKPKARECARVHVFDDLGTEVLGANAFACTVQSDGTCLSAPFPNVDRKGRMWMIIRDRTVTYRLSPFIINSGWPCPLILDDGVTTFHGGITADHLGADLLAGTVTITLHHPSEAECAPPGPQAHVTVVDDLGNLVTTGASFVCRVQPDGTCTEEPFPQLDTQGRLVLNNIDPAGTYRLSPFIINSGWPCPLILDDGVTTFHGGITADHLGADLLAGTVTITLHHPSEAECAPPGPQAHVTVVDDLGNLVTTGASFVCRVQPDGTCTEEPFPQLDTQGRLVLNNIDPAGTYRLSPFIINSGWPCPLILDDGVTTFHGGITADHLGADLLAGTVTITLHHPLPSECP